MSDLPAVSDFTDTACVAGRPNGYGLLREVSPDGSVWFYGSVRTPHGFVKVYSQSGHTSLELIRDNTEFQRRWKRGFKRSYLVTLATRFAKEYTHD